MEIPQEKIDRAKEILVGYAKNKSAISYAGFYNQIGLNHASPLDRQIGSHILGAVSHASFEEKRVMLSSLVFGKVQNEPAEGFYDLARVLKPDELRSGATEVGKTKFWFDEMHRCWESYEI